MEDGKVVGLRMTDYKVTASYSKRHYFFFCFVFGNSLLLRDSSLPMLCRSTDWEQPCNGPHPLSLETNMQTSRFSVLLGNWSHSSRPSSLPCSPINLGSPSHVTSLFLIGWDSECATSRVSRNGNLVLDFVRCPGSFASETLVHLIRYLQRKLTWSSGQMSSWCSSPQRGFKKNI